MSDQFTDAACLDCTDQDIALYLIEHGPIFLVPISCGYNFGRQRPWLAVGSLPISGSTQHMDEIEGNGIHFAQRRSSFKEVTGGEGRLEPVYIPKANFFPMRLLRSMKIKAERMPSAKQRRLRFWLGHSKRGLMCRVEWTSFGGRSATLGVYGHGVANFK